MVDGHNHNFNNLQEKKNDLTNDYRYSISDIVSGMSSLKTPFPGDNQERIAFVRLRTHLTDTDCSFVQLSRTINEAFEKESYLASWRK
jgi:hypothetical protein